MVKFSFSWLLVIGFVLIPAAAVAQTAPGSVPSVARRPPARKAPPAEAAPPALERVAEEPATAKKPGKIAARKIDPATYFPLLAFRVEGAKRLDARKIRELSGLKVGQKVNQDSFSAAHLALMDTGLFESVAYRFEKPAAQEGYIATFEVEETGLFYPIRFEEIPAEREALLAYLEQADPAYDGKSAATVPALQRYSRLIEQYLAASGTEMKVRGQVWAEQGGDLSVMYRPDTTVPSISDVRFEGSIKIEPLELRRVLIQTATGLMFTEDRFRTVLNNEIVPAYWAIGHLGVTFPKIEAVALTEEKGVRVTVTVDEGPEFTLKDAHIKTSVFPEAELLKTGKFPIGETARMKTVAEGVKEILSRYKREGYIEAEAKFDPELDFKEKTADLTVMVNEGPQYLFKELKIEGLDLVNEAGLRKLWSMDPGKPFNALYPDFFLAQIRERQLMESLGSSVAKVDRDEKGHSATVTLVFKAEDTTPKPRVPLVRPQ
ncbi:MAG: POTRA domain-containing protein [Bryobacterales bacterium]|nr:POTRA domain-containing protein [Bryobacterales bacterium]